jgi:arylsulfatase A-like enzyme
MISRRNLISTSAAALAAAGLGLNSRSASATPLPNIVFISIDDLNCMVEGFGSQYTGPIYTPNLTRLANMGMRFTRAYTPSSQCQPARSAVLSGIAPWVSGFMGGDANSKLDFYQSTPTVTLPPGRSVVSLVKRLATAGYRTYGGGKVFHEGFLRCGASSLAADAPFYDAKSWTDWFVSDQNIGEPAPPAVHGAPGDLSECGGEMQSYLPIVPMQAPLNDPVATPFYDPRVDPLRPLPRDAALARYGLSRLAIEANSPGATPFFLALGFFKPHLPWFAPQAFFDLYKLASVRANLGSYASERADLADTPIAACGALGRDVADPPPSLRPHIEPNANDPNPEQTWLDNASVVTRAYLASISYVDFLIGTLIDALPPNTNVILWSDHGYSLGRKLGFAKFNLYEEGSRVPLIVAGPAVAARVGQTCSRVVSLMDLYPTVAQMGGYATSALTAQFSDGQSLFPLFASETATWADEAVTAYSYVESPGERRYPGINVNNSMPSQGGARCLSERAGLSAVAPATYTSVPPISTLDPAPRIRVSSYSIRNANFRYTNYFQTGLYQSTIPAPVGQPGLQAQLINEEMYYHGPVLAHRPPPDPGERTNLLDCNYVNTIAVFDRRVRRDFFKTRLRTILNAPNSSQVALDSLGCLTGT